MRVYAFADKFGARAQKEIALHPFPGVMKFIFRRPHIRPRRFDRVGRFVGVILNRAGRSDCADVLVMLENANRRLLRWRGGGKSDGKKQCKCEPFYQHIDLLPPPNAVALWRGIPTLSAVAHFS